MVDIVVMMVKVVFVDFFFVYFWEVVENIGVCCKRIGVYGSKVFVKVGEIFEVWCYVCNFIDGEFFYEWIGVLFLVVFL